MENRESVGVGVQMALTLAMNPSNHEADPSCPGPVDRFRHGKIPLSTAAGSIFGPASISDIDIILRNEGELFGSL